MLARLVALGARLHVELQCRARRDLLPVNADQGAAVEEQLLSVRRDDEPEALGGHEAVYRSAHLAPHIRQRYRAECACIAAAQFAQQNAWSPRDSIVLSSTMAQPQWAQRRSPGWSSAWGSEPMPVCCIAAAQFGQQ